jgi:hypothetical protein
MSFYIILFVSIILKVKFYQHTLISISHTLIFQLSAYTLNLSDSSLVWNRILSCTGGGPVWSPPFNIFHFNGQYTTKKELDGWNVTGGKFDRRECALPSFFWGRRTLVSLLLNHSQHWSLNLKIIQFWSLIKFLYLMLI